MKKIAPAAIIALQEALCSIYWFKRDFKRFVMSAVQVPDLLARINWDDPKRDVAATIVGHLARNESKLRDVLTGLMLQVAAVKDFSHLRQLDGGEQLVKKAESAVKALRAYTSGFEDVVEEQRRIEERQQANVVKLEKVQAVRAKLSEMYQEFLDIIAPANAQRRGYLLEGFLQRLFELFDMDPRASFKLKAEQIDGAFTFEQFDYLLEAKWEKEPIPRSALDAFHVKLLGKLDNTLGLYISINGYSGGAIETYGAGSRRMVLMIEGGHLLAVVDGRIELPELLRRIKRYASETGEVYLPIDRILKPKE